MLCPSCKHENRAVRKFCVHCGAGLEFSCCPSCGASTEPGEQFCGECGKSLARLSMPAVPPDPRSYTPKHLAEKILTSRSALEGLGEDLVVGQPLQAFLAEALRIVPVLAEPVHDPYVHAHVGEERHRRSLGGEDLLL